MHDLKHTFGRRLRAAGVPNETRKVLLGHRNGDITTHYSAPELQELLEAANRLREQQSGKTPALVALKEKVVAGYFGLSHTVFPTRFGSIHGVIRFLHQ